MRRVLLLPLVLIACRYMAPAQNAWTPARPYAAGPGVTSTSGDAPLTANRCGIDCATGFHCDQKTASCLADEQKTVARDAGAPWLP